jgi:hypothetical protein
MLPAPVPTISRPESGTQCVIAVTDDERPAGFMANPLRHHHAFTWASTVTPTVELVMDLAPPTYQAINGTPLNGHQTASFGLDELVRLEAEIATAQQRTEVARARAAVLRAEESALFDAEIAAHRAVVAATERQFGVLMADQSAAALDRNRGQARSSHPANGDVSVIVSSWSWADHG